MQLNKTFSKTLSLPRKIAPSDHSETATTGKGMPNREVRPDRARVGSAKTPHDAAVETSLSLPHERDQDTDMTEAKPDPVTVQAQRDVSRGLQDTSKSPEMDSAYKKLK